MKMFVFSLQAHRHRLRQKATPTHNNDYVEVSFYLTRSRVCFRIVCVLELRVPSAFF